jgi:lysophospholipase L1-like esterase
MGPWPRKMTLTIAALAAMFFALDFVPPLAHYHVLDWRAVRGVLDFVPRRSSTTPADDEQRRLRPDLDQASLGVTAIDDPAGNLDRFYERLEAVESGKPGAVARILHYGDSPTTADQITSDMRVLMQKRFGDAGHGYCLMAKPWAWYEHRGVRMDFSGWEIDPANQSITRDGLYGLGGVSCRGFAGSETVYTLRDATHTRLELDYLEQPGGGTLSVEADGVSIGEVSTSGDQVRASHTGIALPALTRRLRIRVSSGAVRVFGVEFTKSGAGVIYDSLGLNGAYITVLARLVDGEHWAQELKHADPALVVINYGTNETAYPLFVDTTMPKELRMAVQRVRGAVPRASILIMSPMDRGERGAGGEIGSPAVMARLVAGQHSVAIANGCAFFNTFQAMGGAGTMGRWYQAEPRLVGADLIHPMPAGARIVANLFYKALMNGYHSYRLRHLRARPSAKAVH